MNSPIPLASGPRNQGYDYAKRVDVPIPSGYPSEHHDIQDSGQADENHTEGGNSGNKVFTYNPNNGNPNSGNNDDALIHAMAPSYILDRPASGPPGSVYEHRHIPGGRAIPSAIPWGPVNGGPYNSNNGNGNRGSGNGNVYEAPVHPGYNRWTSYNSGNGNSNVGSNNGNVGRPLGYAVNAIPQAATLSNEELIAELKRRAQSHPTNQPTPPHVGSNNRNIGKPPGYAVNTNVKGSEKSIIPKGLHSGIQEGGYPENGGFHAPIPSTPNPRATPPNPTPFSKERVQAILTESYNEETLRKHSGQGVFEAGKKIDPQLQSRNPYTQVRSAQPTTSADPSSVPSSSTSRYKSNNPFHKLMKS